MTVIDFYRWADNTPVSLWMRGSTYVFPLVEVVHLFGITLLLGCLYTVNLRLFGLTLKGRTISEVAQGVARWEYTGYAVVFTTGIMLFLAEAMKCYDNSAWPFKVTFLILGSAVQFTLCRAMTKPGRAEAAPFLAKLTAVLSTIFWFGAGMAGRAIGFV
jgi:hypothetical protein